MKLVFTEQRTYEGFTYQADEHEVADGLAAQLLEAFPKVVVRWKPATKKEPAVLPVEPKARK